MLEPMVRRSRIGFALVALVATAGVLPAAMQRGEVQELVFPLSGSDGMRYALSVPRDYDAGDPRPLVLALHPAGPRSPYIGGSFMRRIVEPALRSWQPIIVAPDCPTRAWTSATAEQAVLALLRSIMASYAIDRARVLVTGFSLGGRGTWFLATRHADLFTGAIPIAGSPDDDALEGLGAMPIHIIHSVDDEVVPIGPDQAAASELRRRGHPVAFTELEDVDHYTVGRYIGALTVAGAWMAEQWERVRR